MKDHVLVFATEEAAKAALPQYVYETDDGSAWDGSCVIPGLSVITQEAVWDNTDPENPVLVTPRQVLPGWWIAIGLTSVSEALRDLPGNACRLIADRDAANTGQSFLVYVAPDIDLEALSSAMVDPAFAGASYPFGSL